MLLMSAVLLIMKVGRVMSVLDVYPRNKAVLAGQRMEMTCKTNGNEIVNRWTATRVGQAVEVIFRAKQQTSNPKKQLDSPLNWKFPYFGVQLRQIDDFILYSNITELKDAGVYTCFKNQDAIKSSAQLTVLESNPVCESNISAGKNDFSMSADIIISLKCSVNFSTVDFYPSMEWIQHNEDAQLIRNDGVTMTTNTTVTSVLHVSISSIENGSYFSCLTFFRPYNGSVKTIASNTPDFRFIWNSTKLVFQENAVSTDNNLHVKDTFMSSDSKMGNSVTTALVDGIGTDSSGNYWFFVSLSLVVVVSIFFVLMAIMALNFYICRKRITKGREDPVHARSVASLDHPMSEEYEIMPYAYTDGYDKIDDDNVTDFDVTFSRREGPLPVPGYDHLLAQPSIPTVYSPIDNYEHPMDREDSEINSGHVSESHDLCVKVNVKPPAYIQLISETEELSPQQSSTYFIARKEINRSSITSSDSINEIPSSYLKINEDATEDGFDLEEIPSSYLKIG